MSDFGDSLTAREQSLIDCMAELREARERAEAALRSGDQQQMRHALNDLRLAKARAKWAEQSR